MKKLILALSMVLAFASFSFAQTAPAKTPTTAGPTKKDGSADMRYKANKNAKTPPVHTKKDGTADKRFKENKTTTATPPKKG